MPMILMWMNYSLNCAMHLSSSANLPCTALDVACVGMGGAGRE